MDSDALNSIIKELSGEGTVHSTGEFIIDYTSALSKLREFQLSEPYLYVLPMISAAIHSGASFVKVKTDLDDCIIMFDGDAFLYEELGNLLMSIFYSGSKKNTQRLMDLAIGVNTALTLKPLFLSIESGNENKIAKLNFDEKGQKLEEITEISQKVNWTTKVHVRKKGGLKLLGGIIKDVTLKRKNNEGYFIKKFCSLAPPSINITVNNRLINNYVDFGNCTAWSYLRGDIPFPLAITVPPTNMKRNLDISAPFSAVIGVGGSWNGNPRINQNDGCVVFVVNGVSFFYYDDELGIGCDNLLAVVFAPYLKPDLSRQKIIKNQDFKDIITKLREELIEIMELVGEKADEELNSYGLDFLGEVSRKFRMNADLDRTLLVQEKLSNILSKKFEKEKSIEISDDFFYSRLEFAAILIMQGRYSMAKIALQKHMEWLQNYINSNRIVEIRESIAMACFFMARSGQAINNNIIEAIPILEIGIACKKGFYPSNTNNYFNCLRPAIENLAYIYAVAGIHEKAKDFCEQALDLMRKTGNIIPVTLQNVAIVYLRLGLKEKALALCEQAVLETEKVIKQAEEGNNSFKTKRNGKLYLAIAIDHLAVACFANNLTARTEEMCGRSMVIYKKILGENHPEIAGTTNLLAKVYLAKNTYDLKEEALKLFGFSLSITENVWGKNHPQYKRIAEEINCAQNNRNISSSVPLVVSHKNWWFNSRAVGNIIPLEII